MYITSNHDPQKKIGRILGFKVNKIGVLVKFFTQETIKDKFLSPEIVVRKFFIQNQKRFIEKFKLVGLSLVSNPAQTQLKEVYNV